MYLILEIIGTVAFAISGAMAGVKAKMDLFGVVVLGLTTAVGGGIIRDILIGIVPPIAFQKPIYALVAIAVSLLIFLPVIRSRIHPDGPFLNLLDAVGLGVFTAVGVTSGASFHNIFLQLFLGVVTGVGGGVLRDIFAAEKPMIFVKHFYATASFFGAAVALLLFSFGKNIAMMGGISVVVILRYLAARFKWHLPKA